MGGGQGSGRNEGTKSGETRQEKAGTECCGQGRCRCGLEKALGGKEGGCEEIACELECIAAVNPRERRQNSEFGLPGHARNPEQRIQNASSPPEQHAGRGLA